MGSQGFTFTEANDIEQILVNIETIINLMLSSIIYTGEISKDDLDEQLKIRVWVSDEYKSNDVLGFSYHLDVIVKNS